MELKKTAKIRKILIALLIAGTLCIIPATPLLSKYDGALIRTVTAVKGLNIREAPDVQSKKTGVVPFNEDVEVIEAIDDNIIVGDKYGYWLKVKWKKLTGWAFDAYLSPSDKAELLKQFISIEIYPEEESCCNMIKKAGGDRMILSCDCGSYNERNYIADRPAKVQGYQVVFETSFWLCNKWDESGQYEISNCVESETTYSECSINGNDIFDPVEGGTLKTSYKCNEIKRVKQGR